MDVSVGYRHVLRRQWSNLIRDLPEASDLLSDPILTPLFTQYEHEEIRCPHSAAERSEKFVKAIERKGEDVYRAFVTVLREYRPSLADNLIRSAEEVAGRIQESGNKHQLVNGHHVEVEDSEEDAGIQHFNTCGPGPMYRLQHMSITCRHSLADEINQSAMFPQFCHALGVDEELRIRATRSRNPTAYMLQEYQELPEATFDQLQQALSRIGRKDLYDQVWQLMQNS